MREKQHQRGLSASYLEPDRYDEEEEGEESISLAAIKNRYKGGIRGQFAQKLNLVVSGFRNLSLHWAYSGCPLPGHCSFTEPVSMSYTLQGLMTVSLQDSSGEPERVETALVPTFRLVPELLF